MMRVIDPMRSNRSRASRSSELGERPRAARSLERRARPRTPRSSSAFFGALALFVPLALLARGPARAADREATPAATRVEAVVRVGFTVSDLDRAVTFFTEVLDFERIDEREDAGDEIERLTGVFAARIRSARLRLGSEEIELSEYLAPASGRAFPDDSQPNDLWFQHIAIVVSDMDAAYARLRQHRVRHASSGPQRLPDWNPDAGGIEAFYFRDPDGHYLELIHFPHGKSDPRWQAKSKRLFLGIDHTAIAVDDSERSLAFYRDRLGLRVAGTSENYGREQERLNAVFGAHLRITGLRAAGGPGIEFLEYLTPQNGRPRPRRASAQDLLYWHVDLSIADAQAAHRTLRTHGVALDSPDVAAIEGRGRAFTAADPDGHRLRFVTLPSSATRSGRVPASHVPVQSAHALDIHQGDRR